jgi:hypothetical protein
MDMYDAMPCPGKILYGALKSFGETEWTRGALVIQNDDDWNYPPVVAWRYKEKDEKREQLIVDAVETFKGNIQWTTTFRDRERLPGRNWSIMPKRFKEFLDELKNNRDIIKTTGALSAEGAFAVIEPEVGETANREISQLAEHIKKFVQARLSIAKH